MTKPRTLWISLLLVFLSAGTGVAERLEPKDISRLGKAATALVEVNSGKSSGTAFCIEESGMFLTNAHVVRNVRTGMTVRLALEPGEASQKIFKAVVVMRDDEADLAVLKVKEKTSLKPLKLGTSEDLYETMQIYAFGFPFGKSLSFAKGDFPAISVNAGRVTSLRKKDGVLELVQIDAALNPGNSGGPLLNDEGKVVAIVRSGVQGSGVNFAIPVAKAREFLSKMLVLCDAPDVSVEDLEKPVRFEARVLDFLRPGEIKEVEVELTLASQGRPPIRRRMKREGDIFCLETHLLPRQEKPAELKATVVYERGELKGEMEPVVFKVKVSREKQADRENGEKEEEEKEEEEEGRHDEVGISLDDVAEIIGGDNPVIVLRAGRETREIDPDTRLTLNVGPHKIAVELSKVKRISVSAPLGTPAYINYTVCARVGEKEVGRAEGEIHVRGAISTGEQKPVDLSPAEFKGDTLIKKCPGSMDDVIDAAGGRLLICHFPRLRKLGIFDVQKLEFVKYISVNDGKPLFAAGRDVLIVALPGSGIMQRWNLTTFEREVTVAIPFTAKLIRMSMGSNGNGPLLIAADKTISRFGGNNYHWGFMDIGRMKMIEGLRLDGPMNIHPNNQNCRVRASGNGRLFGMWYTNNTGMQTIVLEDDLVKAYYVRDSERQAVPGPNGEYVYGSKSVYSSELRQQQTVSGDENHVLIPARHGHYSLGVTLLPGSGRSSSRNRPTAVDAVIRLYHAQNETTLARFENLKLVRDFSGRLTLDKRLWCLPMARVLITIPLGNDKLVIHKFYPEKALEDSGIDYLFVDSEPPSKAIAGTTFFYSINVRSKRGGVGFKLEGAPDRMRLDGDGLIVWDVPADFKEERLFIIVVITDATKQEIYHNFELKIVKPED